jgi:hypothetical protein
VEKEQEATREAEEAPRRRYTAADVKAKEDKSDSEWEGVSLEQVPWTTSHIQAFLTRMDNKVRLSTCQASGRKPWVNSEDVEKILEKVTVDNLQTMCERLGVGEDEGLEMEMDMYF